MGFYAVVFDFDGVLVKSEQEVNVEAARRVFRERRMPLSKAELHSIPGKGISLYAPPLLQARGITDPDAVQEAKKTIRERYDELWAKEVRLMPGAKRVVKELRGRRVTLAIATANRRAIIEQFFARFGFRDSFDFAVTAENVERQKPDPQAYLLARACTGLPAERILAVEDTEIGVAAAKGAGLPCAALRNAFTAAQDLSQADFQIPALGMLLSL